jgi:hypothetical protein
VRGAFIGFLVMLAVGAGGSGVARMTVLERPQAARPPAAAVETPAPHTAAGDVPAR